MIIIELIENMPLVLEYFLPGYLCVFFYRRFKNNNSSMMSEKIHIGTAVCISYLVRLALKSLYHILISCSCFTFLAIFNTSVWRTIIATTLCILSAILLARARRRHDIRQEFSKIAQSSLSENVFEDCDLDSNQNVTVYLNGKLVKGRLILYGQDQNDQWLVIDKCTVKDMEGKVVSDWIYHGYERYLIPIKEIKGLVVHYSESSELVPKGLLESRAEAQKKN